MRNTRQNLWIYRRQIGLAWLTRQRIHLNAAGVFKDVHLQEGIRNGIANG